MVLLRIYHRAQEIRVESIIVKVASLFAMMARQVALKKIAPHLWLKHLLLHHLLWFHNLDIITSPLEARRDVT